ncbi:MAG: hypothetical protein ABUT20_06995 [Bacteroidota bacterium]
MEVHAHSHTERKKWTHYFWEFFMLFLAVTAGFFVENQREHLVENHRAKQYAVSLLIDLKEDTTSLRGMINGRNYRKERLDSLMDELEKPLLKQNDTILFHIGIYEIANRAYFSPRTGTYEQIQNSGSLRYFPSELATKLVYYNSLLGLLDKQLEIENKYVIENVINLRGSFCNQKYLRYEKEGQKYSVTEPLISKNRDIQLRLYSATNYLLERNKIYILYLNKTKDVCVALVNDLKENYHIE